MAAGEGNAMAAEEGNAEEAEEGNAEAVEEASGWACGGADAEKNRMAQKGRNPEEGASHPA